MRQLGTERAPAAAGTGFDAAGCRADQAVIPGRPRGLGQQRSDARLQEGPAGDDAAFLVELRPAERMGGHADQRPQSARRQHGLRVEHEQMPDLGIARTTDRGPRRPTHPGRRQAAARAARSHRAGLPSRSSTAPPPTRRARPVQQQKSRLRAFVGRMATVQLVDVGTCRRQECFVGSAAPVCRVGPVGQQGELQRRIRVGDRILLDPRQQRGDRSGCGSRAATATSVRRPGPIPPSSASRGRRGRRRKASATPHAWKAESSASCCTMRVRSNTTERIGGSTRALRSPSSRSSSATSAGSETAAAGNSAPPALRRRRPRLPAHRTCRYRHYGPGAHRIHGGISIVSRCRGGTPTPPQHGDAATRALHPGDARQQVDGSGQADAMVGSAPTPVAAAASGSAALAAASGCCGSIATRVAPEPRLDSISSRPCSAPSR